MDVWVVVGGLGGGDGWRGGGGAFGWSLAFSWLGLGLCSCLHSRGLGGLRRAYSVLGSLGL